MNPPVFGHGELRLVLLTLIAREPRHGYDLIHALNEHFEGDYSPSAGTIYPRLAKLQEEGLVSKTQDGRKTVYSITEAGLREVEARREEFDRITTERTDEVRTLAQSARAGLAEARRGLREELDQIATQARAAAEEALHREHAATAAEQAAKAATEAAKAAEQASADADARVAAAEATARERAAQAQQHAEQAAGEQHADQAGEQTGDQHAEQGAEQGAEEALERGRLVRRVDVALQQFRMEVRQDARETNHLGGLDEETVSEIETQLRETRRRLGSLLRIHR